jgi:hypothetical protein
MGERDVTAPRYGVEIATPRLDFRVRLFHLTAIASYGHAVRRHAKGRSKPEKPKPRRAKTQRKVPAKAKKKLPAKTHRQTRSKIPAKARNKPSAKTHRQAVPKKRTRRDSSLDGVKARPFGDLDVIEKVLGHEVPAAVKDLWSRLGEGTISGGVYIYDADLVRDLCEQYEDAGLADLLPLASDGGSSDFAVDLVGRNGLPVGTILLLDRGTMTEGSLQPVAADVVARVMAMRCTDSNSRATTPSSVHTSSACRTAWRG